MLQGKGFIFSDKAASIYVGIGLAHQDIVQQMWSSAFILIAMEACIIMVTFGDGFLEGLLQIAQESLGGFMRL